MDENLKNDYVKNGLDYIRRYIKRSVHNFDYERSLIADQEIKSDLEKVYEEVIVNGNNKNKCRIKNRNYTSEEYKIFNKLSIKYYAICNDNLELLDRLNKENYSFGKQNIKFFALDKNFTKYFSDDELIFLLKSCNEECESFFSKLNSVSSRRIDNNSKKELLDRYSVIRDRLLYDSLLSTKGRIELKESFSAIAKELSNVNVYKYSDEEKDLLMRNFRQIILEKPNIAKKKEKFDSSRVFRDLLTPDNLMIYGRDMLLGLSYYQREMVNRNYNGKDNTSMERIRDILLEHPGFCTSLHFTEGILNNFTNQEIVEMSPDFERVVTKVDDIGYTDRIKNMALSEDDLLDDEFIDPDFLNALSDEQIKNLSLIAQDKIKKVLLNKRKFVTYYGDRYRLTKKIRGIEMFDSFMQKVGLRRK